ncbi:MAG: carboxymuconolactone decarboxylase family protein [Halioglobus sp.]
MAFIETVATEDSSGMVREMYLRQQQPWGVVPNYAKVFCHRPQVMQAWADLQRTIAQSVDAATFQLVTLAASQALGSSYCSLAFGSKLSEGEFSREQLEDIVSNDNSPHLNELQQACMTMARKVARNSNAVCQQDIDHLRELGMEDATIFDIIAIASARCFFATLVNSLGAQPDSHFQEMTPSLRDLLCVGRAISSAEAQRLE